VIRNRLTRQQYRETIPEDAWQAMVVTAARRLGWRVYHTHDSRRSEPGFPDLVLVRPPDLLFIELKTVKGRVTPEQVEWIADLGLVGKVEAFVWRPGDDYAAVLR
jgi:hypothetical protein